MSHVVVQARPGWQLWLFRVLAVVLALLLAWGMYEYGRYQGGFRMLESRAIEVGMQQRIEGLQQEAQQMREQNAILARSAEIDREAYRQLEVSVNLLHDEMSELKRELEFYRGIVSPGDASHSLEVQRFELQRTAMGRYRYTLVLTQVLDNSNWAEGIVAFVVEGSESSEAKSYSLAELSEEHEGDLAFRYRYFQFFEGELVLPEGFMPKQVALEVKPRGRTHKAFSQSYDWLVQEN